MFSYYTSIKICAIIALGNMTFVCSNPTQGHCVFTSQSVEDDALLFPSAKPCCADDSCDFPDEMTCYGRTNFEIFLDQTFYIADQLIVDEVYSCWIRMKMESNPFEKKCRLICNFELIRFRTLA